MAVWSTEKLTADLLARLRADMYLAVAEVTLRDQTGQRADVLAMRRKLRNGPMLIFEIKTSRSDLLGDLRREKWRGYLDDGAVAFAFPSLLADPSEIPKEAGVYMRISQGWRWARAPKWAEAPLPTPYLFRRMALSAADQYGERARAQMSPRPASLWAAARGERQKQGRLLAQIAQDVQTWTQMVENEKEKYDRQLSIRRRLEDEINELHRRKVNLQREVGA
jgi:hypothetical protein